MARFTQKSKSSGELMVIRQGGDQTAGSGADGPEGSCHGVLRWEEAPGGQTGTARAGGALRATTISRCLIIGSLF